MICTVKQEDRVIAERFERLCDYTFIPGQPIPADPLRTYVIFCKTDHVRFLFSACSQNHQSNYIVFTTNSDFPATHQLIQRMPANVIKWFSQNVEYLHPKLESIPIGSATATWVGIEEHAEIKEAPEYKIIKETKEPKRFQNLVYMNFAIHTNPTHRRKVYEHFKDKEWVTVRPCDIPQHMYERSEHYNKVGVYFEELYNHKFAISPLGNGVDCGRVWQSIYLGTIPIVPNHLNVKFYSDLPILVYDDINEITKPYLEAKWEEMSNKKYDLSKAKVSYWKERIKNIKYA